MTNQSPPENNDREVKILAALAIFLLMFLFVGLVQMMIDQAPVGNERAQLRRQYLAELRKANEEILNQYGWQDQDKGIVRVPIDRAMEIAAREWQDPEAGREQLLARAEKALGPPPEPEPAVEEELEFE